MKKIVFLLMFVLMAGCAPRQNIMEREGYGRFFLGVIMNPTQYTIIVRNSCEENSITIPPESGKTMFLPRERVTLIYTYYLQEKRVGTWEDREYISPSAEKYCFENRFYWWKIIIRDALVLDPSKNLDRRR